MTIVHLTASPFFGGPERQMLGLASVLPEAYRSVFLSFAEGGRCRPFLDEARRQGFEAEELLGNAPRYRDAAREAAGRLKQLGADVLCCHGYKADILGGWAARMAGVPAVAVARGWTGATFKVRLNEALDRLCMRRMDRVVCVSEGQAVKVRRAGVRADRVVVIRNAIRAERFDRPDPSARGGLLDLFPEAVNGPIVGAAGRLSPEKGVGVLVEAAALVLRSNPEARFVVFGEGPLRDDLTRQVAAKGLEGRFLLPGFRDDLDRLLPAFDVFALPSFTEGLPNVALEASASGVAVVATAVGGTPEAVKDGVNGLLVPAGDPAAFAARLLEVLGDDDYRRALGRRGRDLVRRDFTFEGQGGRYQRLFDELLDLRTARTRP